VRKIIIPHYALHKKLILLKVRMKYMAIIIDEYLVEKVIERLKKYVDIVNHEDGVDILFEMIDNTEDLIEELKEELEDAQESEDES
jgi:hypothetical protein